MNYYQKDAGDRGRSSGSGFTLLEMLVVVAIISLLAAILFPVFSRVREDARRSSCASNLKQLGLGMLQYSIDNDEHLPIDPLTAGASHAECWGGLIYPYVKSVPVFTCPDDLTQPTISLTFVLHPISYAYNECIGRQDGYGVKGALSEFTAPAQTVLLAECGSDGTAGYPGARAEVDQPLENSVLGASAPGLYSPAGTGTDLNNGGSRQQELYETGWVGQRGNYVAGDNVAYPADTRTELFDLQGRHVGGANYLMADGHVKFALGDHVSSGDFCAVGAVNPTTPKTAQDTLCNGTVSLAAGTSGTMPDGSQPLVTFSPI